MDKQSKIILISGPTASGKSNFAIRVAKKINGEIINADSMQVYKQLKILTARPNTKEQKNIKHHMYGVVDLNKKFSTGQCLKTAIKNIKEIKKKKKNSNLSRWDWIILSIFNQWLSCNSRNTFYF
jgi:tRNA dimethylallyltransferase